MLNQGDNLKHLDKILTEYRSRSVIELFSIAFCAALNRLPVFQWNEGHKSSDMHRRFIELVDRGEIVTFLKDSPKMADLAAILGYRCGVYARGVQLAKHHLQPSQQQNEVAERILQTLGFIELKTNKPLRDYLVSADPIEHLDLFSFMVNPEISAGQQATTRLYVDTSFGANPKFVGLVSFIARGCGLSDNSLYHLLGGFFGVVIARLDGGFRHGENNNELLIDSLNSSLAVAWNPDDERPCFHNNSSNNGYGKSSNIAFLRQRANYACYQSLVSGIEMGKLIYKNREARDSTKIQLVNRFFSLG